MFSYFNLELPDFNNVRKFGILRWNNTYEIYEYDGSVWLVKEFIGNPKIISKLNKEYKVSNSIAQRIYTRDPKSLFNIVEFEDSGEQLKKILIIIISLRKFRKILMILEINTMNFL